MVCNNQGLYNDGTNMKQLIVDDVSIKEICDFLENMIGNNG